MKEEAFKSPSTSTPFFNQTIIVNVVQKGVQDGILTEELASFFKDAWTAKILKANVDPPFIFRHQNLLREPIVDETKHCDKWEEPSAGTLTIEEVKALPNEDHLFDDIPVPENSSSIPFQSKLLVSNTKKFACANEIWCIRIGKDRMYVYAKLEKKDYIYHSLKIH